MTERRRFLLRDCVGWGVALWLFGYLLGFVFFAIVPPEFIGWSIMPVGTAVTLFVLWKWVRLDAVGPAILLGMAWAAIAIVFDYVFLVTLLNPPDGYYKPAVYIYYALALVLPLVSVWLRLRRHADI